MTVDIDHAVPELAERFRWAMGCFDADTRRKGYKLVVNDVWRPWAQQVELRARWDAAVRKYGAATAPRYAPLAAIPGTSMHGKMRDGKPAAEAIDAGCDPRDNWLRAYWFDMAGLWTPVPGEPWHCQLRPGRGPLPAPYASSNAAQRIEPLSPKSEEDDMCALTYNWANGGAITIDEAGNVDVFDAPHYGGIGSLPPERREGFVRAVKVTPVDPKDCNAGYVIWHEKGADGNNERYEFNLGVRERLLAGGY